MWLICHQYTLEEDVCCSWMGGFGSSRSVVPMLSVKVRKFVYSLPIVIGGLVSFMAHTATDN